MTKKQYIQHLTQSERRIQGKDVPQKACAGVIDGLCAVIADRDAVIADKDAVIADKDVVIASKDELIAKLSRQVSLFQRQIYGRRSERLHPEDPNQLSLDFGEEQVLPLSDEQLKEEAVRVEDTKAAVHKEADSRRAQKRSARTRKGQTYRIGPEVPRQDPVEFYPDGYDPETMTVIGWNTHEYLEIEGPKLSVRVEREAICKLKSAKPTDAHTQIFEARKSQNCLPGCIAGNKTMATIITDKYCHHLPEYRQVKRFGSMGLKLSTTSINRWQHDLADVLLPIYERQTELVFSSRYQHLDETTIPINDQRHHTRKGYIWDAVDGMGEYGLVFFYEKGSRGGKVIRPKLLHRKAAIQSDGYTVYENIEKSQMEGIVTLYCMAHARRRFEQIKDTSPEARKVLEYIATLYELEANLRYANADHDEIRRQRQEKAVPILGFIRLMLEKYRTVDTPASALARACGYALERWDGLCRYCDEGYYEIDNNAVERSIRPVTLGRKNWLFVDSDESAKDAALYMTLIGSCNLLGIAPYKYFEYILPRLHGNMTKQDYEKLLPYKVAKEIRKG
jgi:transposase